jgi:hypothetical protein
MAVHVAAICPVCEGPLTRRGECTRAHDRTPKGALVVRLLGLLQARAAEG